MLIQRVGHGDSASQNLRLRPLKWAARRRGPQIGRGPARLPPARDPGRRTAAPLPDQILQQGRPGPLGPARPIPLLPRLFDLLYAVGVDRLLACHVAVRGWRPGGGGLLVGGHVLCQRTASVGRSPDWVVSRFGWVLPGCGIAKRPLPRLIHRRRFTVLCDPMTASRPLLSPAGDASAMPAPPAVPVDGDTDRTDLPCSRTPAPAWSSVLRRRRSPSAASSLLRNPPGGSSWTCGASSGRRLMAPASLHNNYEAARGTRERWSSTPDARTGS